jgi:peptidoglycan hydrolase-like protein with peptidoglycan-binding domain
MARTVKTAFNDLPTMYDLGFAVGPNGPNVFSDVMLVQVLMKMANFARFAGGSGPVEASRNIKVDGFYGPQTDRLIRAFEANRKSARLLLVEDGVFEPSIRDGFTRTGVLFKIVHLNRMAKQQSPFGNEYNALPFAPSTHPVLRNSLSNGAIRPSGV